MSDDGLPPLRDVIERHGLLAKKSLGQNFLFDLNLTRRIARAAGPFHNTTVVEIGPGPGGLTRALLAEGAENVIAIERDDRAIAALEEVAAAYPGKLHVINGDALQQDWAKLVSGPARIVANLPYNIGTPLLISWLTDGVWPPWYSSLTLMFQKEVADRIVAKPGTEAYGRLSVLCQWRCQCSKLFDVNRAAFTPSPKITSAIVQLVPRPESSGSSLNLERVTAAAFGQRRKMLRSSLKSVFDNPAGVCAAAGIDPELRAEQLGGKQFLALAAALQTSPITVQS
jgi:16S rRNA (adenine1518-N6/adenine1519-N6)-dimethyltransferase